MKKMITEQSYYPFAKAYKVASYILQQLQPHCEPGRIHIAGSIRRMRPDVKDIEIICHPSREFVQSGLFADSGEWLIKKDFSEAIASMQHKIIKGNINGRYMQMITSSKLCPGIKLDLFMPAPEDYFRQYAIRTGSSEYAHNIIAAAWKRKGWVGVKYVGLRRIKDCDCHTDANGKKTYALKQIKIQNSEFKIELPPVWKSEGEFFTWLGLEYTDPEFREFNKIVNEAL